MVKQDKAKENQLSVTPYPLMRERKEKQLRFVQEQLETVRLNCDALRAEVQVLKEERKRMRAVILQLAAEFTAREGSSEDGSTPVKGGSTP